MKIEQKKTIQVDAKVIKICAKCRDCCASALLDAQGDIIKEEDGYVPGFFPDGGGDYVNLEIDLETGKILNWEVPSSDEIQEFVDREE